MTPEQAVFGRTLRWPGVVDTADENGNPLASLGTEGETWCASQIRAAARVVLQSRDAPDKNWRATLRRAPAAIAVPTPGWQVDFWNSHPMKGGQRQNALRWRGSATVVARESVGRDYVGWWSCVLVVVKAQLRLATTDEAAAHEMNGNDMAMTADPKWLPGYDRSTTTGETATRSCGTSLAATAEPAECGQGSTERA